MLLLARLREHEGWPERVQSQLTSLREGDINIRQREIDKVLRLCGNLTRIAPTLDAHPVYKRYSATVNLSNELYKTTGEPEILHTFAELDDMESDSPLTMSSHNRLLDEIVRGARRMNPRDLRTDTRTPGMTFTNVVLIGGYSFMQGEIYGDRMLAPAIKGSLHELIRRSSIAPTLYSDLHPYSRRASTKTNPAA